MEARILLTCVSAGRRVCSVTMSKKINGVDIKGKFDAARAW